jgi:transcriptional regulator with XRE-family HTH domain
MATAGLYSRPEEVESVDTNSTKAQMLEALRASKEYRHAFIEEAIRTRITAQIAALREKEEWDYKKLAEKIGKKVSWAYRLEDPNVPAPTITSLLDVAAAFDIGLDVRFRSFSELLDDVTTLKPASFLVSSFTDELRSGSFSKPRRRKVYRKPPVKAAHALRHSRRLRTGELGGKSEDIGAASDNGGLALAS